MDFLLGYVGFLCETEDSLRLRNVREEDHPDVGSPRQVRERGLGLGPELDSPGTAAQGNVHVDLIRCQDWVSSVGLTD